MGKPTICIGENKDADQLRGDREADQRLCLRYTCGSHLHCKSRVLGLILVFCRLIQTLNQCHISMISLLY